MEYLISKYLGYFIIYFACAIFAIELLKGPIDRVFTVAISAIAIIAALSGICFAFSNSLDKEDKNVPLYAGETFFHSLILIIQILFIKYGIDTLLKYEFIKKISWMQSAIKYFSDLILTIFSISIALFIAYGFDSLNKFLWDRYNKRGKGLIDLFKKKKKDKRLENRKDNLNAPTGSER